MTHFRGLVRCVLVGWISLSGVPSWAATYFYYFGGGGEKGDKRNQFDASLEVYAKTANQKNWLAEYQVDTEHPSTKKKISKIEFLSPRAPISEFNPENFLSRIRKIRDELKEGQAYQSDDQIYVAIDTHGVLDKQKRMSISTTTKNIDVFYDLRDLILEAEKRGVKLVVDLQNCYSGNLLASLVRSADDLRHVCIISSSNPDRVSFSGVKNLIQFLSRTSNVESAFVLGRKELRTTPYQPMISTSAGMKAAKDLEFIKDYMFYASNAGSALVGRNSCDIRESGLSRLQSLAQDLDRSTKSEWYEFWRKSSSGLIEDLEALVREKHDLEERIRTKIASLKSKLPYGSNTDECEAKEIEPNLLRRTGLESKKEFCGYLFSETEKDSESPPDDLKEKLLLNSRFQFAKKSQDFVQNQINREKNRFIESGLDRELVLKERELYDRLYNHYSQEMMDQPNPCRDFKL